MELQNSLMGFQLRNANGDVDPASTGFKYAIDTLSYIRANVIDQKFYRIAIADFMPVDVGEAAWSDETVQNLVFQIAGDFHDGDVNTVTGNGRVAKVDTALAPIRMPNIPWAKTTQWSIIEIEMAARANNWDVVESKMKALKTNWDLGIQKIAFLGHPSNALVTGLLNDPEVNINTALITKPISTMSESEFKVFVGALMGAYFDNTNNTVDDPDVFIMPADDYLGLSVPVSATFPNISMLDYLLNSFQKTTRNPNFKILPLVYSQNEKNTLGVDRYVLYKNDPDTLSMSIPVDFRMLEARTSDPLYWGQPAYGQYSGVLINRKLEVYYIDDTTP